MIAVFSKQGVCVASALALVEIKYRRQSQIAEENNCGTDL